MDKFCEDSSLQGLRTLYFAMKIVDEEELQKFHVKVEIAEQNLLQKEERLE